MEKSKHFIPEALSTLKGIMGYGFMFDLRQQLFNLQMEKEISINDSHASFVDETPIHVDSITLNEYPVDSVAYLKHFTDTAEKALSGEPNSGKAQFELTRMLDNPYSALIYFSDSTEEKAVSLSLLHYAAVDNNADAMNELASFYAPPQGHHKYTKNAFSSTKTALRLLIKASNFGSSQATGTLAQIYANTHHIKEVEPSAETAQALRDLQAAQHSLESVKLNALKHEKAEQKKVDTYNKAKDWYRQTLNSGTGNPLKHEPLHAINKYYEKVKYTQIGSRAGREAAIDYLKYVTKNRRLFQDGSSDISKPMFDLGVMYLKGINGLEKDEQEANSLLATASMYDASIKHQIEAIKTAETLKVEPPPTTEQAPTKRMTGPRLG